LGWAQWPGWTQIELTGADRATFLQNMCTNDIRRLEPGQSCEAFLTSAQGKTVGFVYVHCCAESLWLDTAPGQAETMVHHLERYVIREKVQLHDRTTERQTWVLAGPGTATLAQAAGWELPGQLPGSRDVALGSLPLSLRRVPLLGETTLLLAAAPDAAAPLEALLREHDGIPCTADVIDMRRIEVGTPLFGVDITDENLPQEVGRDAQAISFTKGCYIGQETVARIDALGHVNRRLVGLQLLTDQPPPLPGTRLSLNGKPVARITSACYSQALQAPLALAYVRREHTAPGTRLPCDDIAATVVQLPVGGEGDVKVEK
jgi:folate-binding protein YgfZ